MKVRVEKVKERILLSSDRPTPGLTESIPGAYWRDGSSVWSLPLELTTCYLLRERFGTRLHVGPALSNWAREEISKRERAEALSVAADAVLTRLPNLAPRLYAAMDTRPYQRSGVRFICDARGRDGRLRALLADTVGLGKSAQAIGAVLESGAPGPFMIVCPKTAVESTWAREIKKWLPEDEVITLPDGRAKRDNILNSLVERTGPIVKGQQFGSLQRTWVVIHPAIVRTQTWFICGQCGDKTKYKVGPIDQLSCGHQKYGAGPERTGMEHEHTFPQLFRITWGAIVADESDQILIRLTGTPNLHRRGMELLRDQVPSGGLLLAMSGTPFRSKPHQAWSTLNWLDSKRWSGKWRWVQQYWQTGGYSGYEVSAEGFMDHREHLLVDELKDVMLRRTRDQVRADLPAKLYPSNVGPDEGLVEGIYLQMTKEQERVYQQMEKMGSADLDGGTLDAIGTLAELTRLKQFACAETQFSSGELQFLPRGNKYEWMLALMQELGLPERPATKLVIVSQFTRLLKAFANGVASDLKLKDPTSRIGMITGEVTGRQRALNVETFEDLDSPLDILFLNTKAGGSSITLDAAEVMVFLDETFVADEQEQAEGRIDNREPEKRIVPRSYYYLRSLGTFEESIAAANARAKAMGQRILDGAQIARQAKELMRHEA